MKPTLLNLVSYSGGKDSGALALHLREREVANLVLVFNDTDWEHPATYRYIFEFSRATGIPLHINHSEGMLALCKRKQCTPNPKARFCTTELKIKPMDAYVKGLHAKGIDTVVHIGVRAEESARRAALPMVEHDSLHECLLCRPILNWTIAEVIDIHKRHGIPLNPLYSQGMGRVGCMPCIMAGKAELKAIGQRSPEVFAKLADFERKVGRTFFFGGKIPDSGCSKTIETKDGRQVKVPTGEDVRRWALTGRGGSQFEIPFPISKCESRYGLCE